MTNLKAKIQYLISLWFFGTTGLILRWTILPSEVMVFLRGLLGALLILGFSLLKGRRPSLKAIRSNLGWLIFGGISLGLNWVFLFAAYRFTTVALASLCNYTAPIIVIFLSPILFREKLSGKKLLCVLACLTGFLLVSGVFSSGDAFNMGGILLGMGAALGFVGILIGNKKLRDISPYDRVVVQLLISAAVALPYVIVNDWGKAIPCDGISIFWMLVLAVFYTGVAYSFYFGAMGELPVQSVALLGYLEPVISVLCSALILSEPMSAASVIGAILVIGAAAASELVA